MYFFEQLANLGRGKISSGRNSLLPENVSKSPKMVDWQTSDIPRLDVDAWTVAGRGST